MNSTQRASSHERGQGAHVIGKLKMDTIDERYLVGGQMERLQILTELVLRCEPVYVHFNDGADQLETCLLDVRESGIVFDVGSDPKLNQVLSASRQADFVAFPDGIRVQFHCDSIEEIPWDEGSVFCASFPGTLAKVQRQESYRIHMLPGQEIPATFYAENNEILGIWLIHDLSTDGMGIQEDAPPRRNLIARMTRTTFMLPEFGSITAMVTHRHTTKLKSLMTDAPYRIGLKFSELAADMRVTIQRYIVHSEHVRLAQKMRNSGE